MAKLIQCNVPSRNIRRSRAFYRVLFDDNIPARSLTDEVEAYHQPISVDGIQLTVTPRQSELEQVTCYFAVDDLDATLDALERSGGQVIREPFTLYVAPEVFAAYETEVKQHHPETGEMRHDIGRSAIVLDPDGNAIGLTQLRPQAHWLFKYGNYRVPLERAQVEQHERALGLAERLKPIC
jgi:predicted enzyme related to lactoylglutathione lyase